MKKKEAEKPHGLIIPICVAFFNVLIILFPAEALAAARDGLSLWFQNVLPALLPFVVGTNILHGLGFVSFLGALLEPVMKPMFGVSGSGAFVLSAGLLSGYPMGAKATAALRESGELSRSEAQRLLAFSNNAGPLFVMGTVGTGLLGSEAAGWFILACHITSALLVGLLFRFAGSPEKKQPPQRRGALAKAFRDMAAARQKDGRPFGRVLGDSVKGAVETLTVVGGFIILFCVVVRMMDATGAMALLCRLFQPPGIAFGLEHAELSGLIAGIVEMTNGCRMLAQGGMTKAGMILTVAVISFGGFSIHAQSLSFISHTDLSPGLYLASKGLHGVLSAFVAWLIYPVYTFAPVQTGLLPAFASEETAFIEKLAGSGLLFAFSTGALFVAALAVNAARLYKKRYR